jgi:metal-responsive CopG/Arc/MetJ family transcriptional regulator
MKTIAITIEEDILDRIDRLLACEPPPSNRSKLIREAIREHLTRVECRAEEEREREIFRKQRGRLKKEAEELVKEQAKL